LKILGRPAHIYETLPAINLNNEIDSLPPEEKVKRKIARQECGFPINLLLAIKDKP
jgi:hypothetical protein